MLTSRRCGREKVNELAKEPWIWLTGFWKIQDLNINNGTIGAAACCGW